MIIKQTKGGFLGVFFIACMPLQGGYLKEDEELPKSYIYSSASQQNQLDAYLQKNNINFETLASYYLALAESHLREKNYAQAEQSLCKAAKIYMQHIEIYPKEIARLYILLGDLKNCVEDKKSYRQL